MARTWNELKAQGLNIPVIVDTGTGDPDILVGDGTLDGGTLTIKFGDTFASEATQRALARGEFLALGFFRPNLEELMTEEENTTEEKN